MANNEAYKVLQDTSLPRRLRMVTTVDGQEIEETTGQAYAAGDYVLRDELSQRDQDRVDNGELEGFLEPVPLDEAVEARAVLETGLHIPEHEVERYAMLDAGHRVVEKDQLLELRAAGADAAREAVEASKETPEDANPEITEQPSFVEVPSITEAQNEGQAVVPVEGGEEVDLESIENAPSASASGVEMPPGLPVGPTLAKAEGADPDKVDQESEKQTKRSARRAKPGTSGSAEDKKDD